MSTIDVETSTFLAKIECFHVEIVGRYVVQASEVFQLKSGANPRLWLFG